MGSAEEVRMILQRLTCASCVSWLQLNPVWRRNNPRNFSRCWHWLRRFSRHSVSPFLTSNLPGCPSESSSRCPLSQSNSTLFPHVCAQVCVQMKKKTKNMYIKEHYFFHKSLCFQCLPLARNTARLTMVKNVGKRHGYSPEYSGGSGPSDAKSRVN